MAIRLSDEEKWRIEHEEENRQAQEQYRTQLILGMLFLLFIFYLTARPAIVRLLQ